MLFSKADSPYLTDNSNVQSLMLKVVYALIAGSIAMFWFFGWGVLFNLLLATTTTVAAEAIMLKLRNRPVMATLGDGSAVLTGLLLALALPPLAPWWIPVIGALSAIIVAKQLYGGLGYNPFNPAMVGYVILIISFPLQMTLWSSPRGVEAEFLSFIDTLRMVFTQTLACSNSRVNSQPSGVVRWSAPFGGPRGLLNSG